MPRTCISLKQLGGRPQQGIKTTFEGKGKKVACVVDVSRRKEKEACVAGVSSGRERVSCVASVSSEREKVACVADVSRRKEKVACVAGISSERGKGSLRGRCLKNNGGEGGVSGLP